jgi:hypothetical protein
MKAKACKRNIISQLFCFNMNHYNMKYKQFFRQRNIMCLFFLYRDSLKLSKSAALEKPDMAITHSIFEAYEVLTQNIDWASVSPDWINVVENYSDGLFAKSWSPSDNSHI